MRAFIKCGLKDAPSALQRASSGTLDRAEVREAEALVTTGHPNLLVAGYAPVQMTRTEGGVDAVPQWGRLRTTNRIVWGAFGGISLLVSACFMLMQLSASVEVPLGSMLAFVAMMLFGMGAGVPWLVTRAQARRARRDWERLLVALGSPEG